MKHLFSLLFIFYLVLGQSQTTIPIVGFKGTINTFPTVSNDTITATITLLDISNQFTGNNLTGRDSLVLWKNCKRYRVDTIMTAFATSVTVKLLKEGNPNLTPGVCAFIQETVGNKSFAPAGITDGERQCINAYYAGNDSLSILDTIFINDSLYYVLNGDTINVGKFSSIDSMFINSDSLYYVIGTDTFNVGTIITPINTDSLYRIDAMGTSNVDTFKLRDGTGYILSRRPSYSSSVSPMDGHTIGTFNDGYGTPTTIREKVTTFNTTGISAVYTNEAGTTYTVDASPYNEFQVLSLDSIGRQFNLELVSPSGLGDFSVYWEDQVGVTDTSLINQLISDSLATYVFETDTSLINQLISDSLATINQDQVVSITGAGITNITGTYPSFTVTSTEVDGSTTNEIQTLSQSFTGTTEATYTLSNSGGSVKDTTGFMRLETMFSTPGSRTYRYKSNLGAIMGITEDPTLSGNSNIEVLRTGNQLTWGLRKDNASNGQIYKYNGSAWALATAPTGTVTSVGLGLGTSGTDANVSGSPITGSGSFTLNLPSSSAANRGLLSSADWSTFNGKFTLPSLTSGSVLFSNGSTITQDNSNLFWNNSDKRLGVGTNSPVSALDVFGKLTLRQSGANNSLLIGLNAGNANTGGSNVFMGASAAQNNSTGYQNFAMGVASLFTNTTGYQNIGLGVTTLYSNTNGYQNIAIGPESMYSNTTGYGNVSIGPQTMYNANGIDNVAIASGSLRNVSGSRNVALGTFSGYNLGNASNNVVVGYSALYSGSSSTASNNTIVGYDAAASVTGNFNVIFGRSTARSQTSISNQLWIDNADNTSPLIGGDFSNDRLGINLLPSSTTNTLDVNGTLRVRTTTGTATSLMGRDANGVMITVPISGLTMSSGTLTNSNTGTVTNFSAGDLSPLFTTTESTTTTTPALSFSQVAQSANTVFAGPSSGSSLNPSFRSLVGPDLPAPIVLEYTSSGSFTKALYPGAKKVKVILIGGGGSGGSGQVTAKTTGASARGGGGGGSGAWVETDFEISSLQATTSIVVGAGGTTEPGITSSGSANGQPGNDGGLSSFGLLLVAYGGKGGAPGETSPSGGYGFGGYGRNSWASNGGAGGNFFAGFENDTNETQNLWYSSNAGGGGGGQYESATATISVNGGKSNRAATLAIDNGVVAGGAAGTSSTPPTSGSLYGRYMSSGGGGGGGSGTQANRNGAAGGGSGHGAGGGGGAGVLSTGSSITSGSGGAGAAGRCVVIVYF